MPEQNSELKDYARKHHESWDLYTICVRTNMKVGQTLDNFREFCTKIDFINCTEPGYSVPPREGVKGYELKVYRHKTKNGPLAGYSRFPAEVEMIAGFNANDNVVVINWRSRDLSSILKMFDKIEENELLPGNKLLTAEKQKYILELLDKTCPLEGTRTCYRIVEGNNIPKAGDVIKEEGDCMSRYGSGFSTCTEECLRGHLVQKVEQYTRKRAEELGLKEETLENVPPSELEKIAESRRGQSK